MSPLGFFFRVRLGNFKANGVYLSTKPPPFCVRGNFDGKIFNTEYFHGTSMSPIWSSQHQFDYSTTTIETLESKYLVLECYGGSEFIGMCRIDLLSLARGSQTQCLDLREGSRCCGSLYFEASMELISEVTLRISRLSLSHVASRGPESDPNPYLSYGVADGSAPVESAIAPNSQRPEWQKLPPIHIKGSFRELCQSRIVFNLKHSRNGFTAGINDPLMASFVVQLDQFPILAGRDATFPIRDLVHSAPNYPFPFSCDLTGFVDLCNVHAVAQSGSVEFANPVPVSDRSMNIHSASPSQIPRSLPVQVSPPRVESSQMFYPSQSFSKADLPAQVDRSQDISLLETVCGEQEHLLLKVQQRLEEVRRRKATLQETLEERRRANEVTQQALSEKKRVIEGDIQAAESERRRLEQALVSVRTRIVDEKSHWEQRQMERERSRRALLEERAEAQQMQNRVVKLRDEMHAHLEDEERRYQQRLRDAEIARRQSMQDSAALAALELRLNDAERRFRR